MTKRQKKEEQKQELQTFDSDDYYKILGLTRSCSDADIRDAYTNLALKWHPTQPGGNEQSFQKISEAFSALGDSETRRLYNMFGKQQSLGVFQQQPRQWSSQDANNLFRRVFGDTNILRSPDLFRQPFRPFYQDLGREIDRQFDSCMHYQPSVQGHILEQKTVRSITEIKDGQRVTTTETSTLDRDGKTTKESRTEREDMSSGFVKGDQRIEEIKSPQQKGKKQIKK